MGSLLFAGLSIADNGRQDEHITLWLDNKVLKQKYSQFSSGRMLSCPGLIITRALWEVKCLVNSQFDRT